MARSRRNPVRKGNVLRITHRPTLAESRDQPPWEWSESALHPIHAAIENPALPEEERRLAVELASTALWMFADDALGEALLHLVEDASETETLRAHAAIALGPVLESMDEDDEDDGPLAFETFEEIQDSLKAIHGDARQPKLLRRKVLEASVRAHEDWHAEAIRQALATGDPEWQLTAIFAARWVPGFDRDILAALDQADPVLRKEAVMAAGAQAITAAWPHVRALLRTPPLDPEMLLAAIEAAPGLNPEEAKALLMRYTESRDEDIVEAAWEGIYRIDGVGEGIEEEAEEWEDADFQDLEGGSESRKKG